jgi:phospholipid/cholesterol/gamma-HCH transport system permease protein
VSTFFEFVGEVAILFATAMRRLFSRPFESREVVDQMAFVGMNSVPIVAMTGFSSGAVLSLYLSKFLVEYGATAFVGGTVGLTVTREIGPVLAGIMVAARCGSAMAAQLGTMAVTEQIDALKMLSVHPSNYLVIPRMLAGLVMVPMLALICMAAGVLGGLLVANVNGVPMAAFMQSLQQFVQQDDFLKGMAKAPFFGLIVSLVACQQGLRSTEGAVGVGRATTNTVVISMVLVYVANFVLAQVLFN